LSWNKTWINVPKVRSIWTSLETHMHVHCLTSLSDFVDAQENNLMPLIWEQRDIDFKILVLRILCVSPPVSGRFELLTFYLSFPLAKSAYRQLSRATIVEMFILEPAFCLRFVGWKEFLTLLKKTRYFTMQCPEMSFIVRCSQKQCKLQSRIATFEIRNSTSEQIFLGFFSLCPSREYLCVHPACRRPETLARYKH